MTVKIDSGIARRLLGDKVSAVENHCSKAVRGTAVEETQELSVAQRRPIRTQREPPAQASGVPLNVLEGTC